MRRTFMKRMALILLVLGGLPACSSLSGPASQPGATFETDHAKMAVIERAARSSGVQVIWVNAPRKVVPPGGS
jgi:hypothetical protein